MFIGHFGVGFGAKSVVPTVSLGTLFLAAQFIDLLWPTLLLFGIETVRILPGATTVTPLVFEHYPVSHSLLAVVGWAGLLGGSHYLLRRQRIAALALGALVISHWLLDAVVHQPDLPLFPGSATLAGLNAWSSLPTTLAVELPLFALGVWLYWRATSPRDAVGRWGLAGLVVFLLGIYAGNLSGTVPPSVAAIAWAGQLQWLLVLWGYWLDQHRQASQFNSGTRMPFPVIASIESPRLTLRPVLARDLADLFAVNGDPRVTEFLPYATWLSAEDGAAWLTRMEAIAAAGTGQQFVLSRNADSTIIGTVLLFKYEEASERVELGYVLGRGYWGQGLMREAISATCAHAFGVLGIRRIEAEVNPLNLASCRLLLDVGFALEGRLRQRWVAKGVAYDTNIYACLADDWRLRPNTARP